MSYFLKCNHCEAEFQPKKASQVYCSSRCREFAFRERRRMEKRKPCKLNSCRKVFTPNSAHKDYCSDECQKVGTGEIIQAQKKKLFKDKAQPIKCAGCKSIFKPKTALHKYCSDTCRVRKNQHDDAKFRKEKGITFKPNPKQCEYCGERFFPKSGVQIYCGRICKDKGVKLKQKAWHQAEKRKQREEAEANRMKKEAVMENEVGSWKTVFSNCWVEKTQTPTNLESSEYKDQIEAFLKKGGTIQRQGVGFASNPMSTSEIGEASPLGSLDTRTV